MGYLRHHLAMGGTRDRWVRALVGASLVPKRLMQTVVIQTSQTHRLFFQMASHSGVWSLEYFAITALSSEVVCFILRGGFSHLSCYTLAKEIGLAFFFPPSDHIMSGVSLPWKESFSFLSSHHFLSFFLWTFNKAYEKRLEVAKFYLYLGHPRIWGLTPNLFRFMGNLVIFPTSVVVPSFLCSLPEKKAACDGDLLDFSLLGYFATSALGWA